jgi:hypothetical protein
MNANNVPKDKDKYNLVIFRVGYADQNQSIFKSITLNQSEHKENDEYYKAFSDAIDNRGGTKPMYKKVNLYNLFAIRSYRCTVTCLGNMMVNALNYFQLDNIPFFHGAYLIEKVSHSITAHNIETTFNGIRMPRYTYPFIDSVIAYVQIPLSETLFSADQRVKPVIRPLGGKSYSEAEISESNPNANAVGTYGVGIDTSNTVSVSTVPLSSYTGSLINTSGLIINPIVPANLISTTNLLNRNGKLWNSALEAKYVTVTDAEVRKIMDKTRASGSVSNSQMLNSQIVSKDKLNKLDNHLAQSGVNAYVVGKARVARALGTDANLIKAYGYIDLSKLPADEVLSPERAAFANKYIKNFTMPYAFRTIRPNGSLGAETTILPLHNLVGDSLVHAMQEVLDFYGIDMIKKLGLNLTAGTFVFRKMRWSDSISLHAFGAAIDILSTANLGAWNKSQSLSGESPYTAFLDIMEKWGWHNQGRWLNNDLMHFQAAQYYSNKNNYIA